MKDGLKEGPNPPHAAVFTTRPSRHGPRKRWRGADGPRRPRHRHDVSAADGHHPAWRAPAGVPRRGPPTTGRAGGSARPGRPPRTSGWRSTPRGSSSSVRTDCSWPTRTRPRVPTHARHGPRRPLARDADGDYTVPTPTRAGSGTSPRRDEEPPRWTRSTTDGNRITFEYDETGAPTTSCTGGYHLKLTTDEERVTALHLAGAAAEDRTRRCSVTDTRTAISPRSPTPRACPLRFAYDERGRVTSWTDTNDSRYTTSTTSRTAASAEGGAEGHVALRI